MSVPTRELSLGIDTGGTFTDAVLIDAHTEAVLAWAKAPTTRHDLSVGIAAATDAVIAGIAGDAHVGLVSVSTTLATNALVEGRGGRVALVLIGFDDAARSRSGLDVALGGDPVIHVTGGHDPHGNAVAELDLEALRAAAEGVASEVSGFAVSAQFATRNPAHETVARDLLAELTGLPVTCGHELSARLDGPRRALTSVLNARLIGLTTDLIAATERIMSTHGIDAPLMVVRGDGSLMSVETARRRPIETILSGPAASIVGAAHLTGVGDAVVSDIGGTTTDVAVITGGAPRIDPEGALVGGHRTMVEAVAITTVGLGGDSEVRVEPAAGAAALRLGPRRVVPLSTLDPERVLAALERQLLRESPSELDARFVLPMAESGATTVGLNAAELDLLQRCRAGVAPLVEVVRGQADLRRLDRLVARGLLAVSGFTPTDAATVLGLDGRASSAAEFPVSRAAVAAGAEVAHVGAQLLARQRSLTGRPVAEDASALASAVIDALRRRSAEVVFDVALNVDGLGGEGTSRHPLVAASMDRHRKIVDVAVSLAVPLVGIGASAPLHYPHVAALLRTEGLVPEHAGVANAIGAVVGRVRTKSEVHVSSPERGVFRVHHGAGEMMTTDEAALQRAEVLARADALTAAREAGADAAEVAVTRTVNIVDVGGGESLFVDATITAIATGRPRRAT